MRGLQLLIVVLAFAGFAAQARANEAAALTIGECVRRALERGFEMEIEGLTLALSREEVPIARSAFDPVLSLSAEHRLIRDAADALLPRSRHEGVSTQVGLSQRLFSGAQIGLGFNLDRARANPAVSALNPAYASDLTLALRQPLLQGAGSAVNLTDLRRAELRHEAGARDYRRRALEIIQATETAYYLFAGAHEQLAVFAASLQLARKLFEEAELRKRAGMATGLDVLQAEVGVANARNGVLRAQSAVQTAADALLALIGRFELDVALEPAKLDPPSPAPLPQAQTSYARAVAQAPELLDARAALKALALDQREAEDRLKPVLDLDLAVGLRGHEGSGRGALSSALENDAGAWQAGLTLTWPWGRSGEKARLRQTDTALRRQSLEIGRLEQTLLLQVREAVREVHTQHESVRLTALATELSERQHEAERKRFKAGLTTSRRVLEAQTDLERARVAELQARLDLQVALAALRRIEGSGLEHYGIEPLPAP